jgi:hypothetical protein
MNWRKGFNRVFLLAAIFWTGYILLVYPRPILKQANEYYSNNLSFCNWSAPQQNSIAFTIPRGRRWWQSKSY